MLRDLSDVVKRQLAKELGEIPVAEAAAGTTIGRVINFNAGVLSVGTSDTTLFDESIELGQLAHVIVNLDVTFTVTTALKITVTIYLDGLPLGAAPEQTCTAAGSWHMGIQLPFLSVATGAHTVTVKAKTSTSTASIPANKCYLHLYAEGLVGGTAAVAPEMAAVMELITGTVGPVTATMETHVGLEMVTTLEQITGTVGVTATMEAFIP